MTRSEPIIRVAQDEAALFRLGVERLLDIGRTAVTEHGAFHLALAGGATPRGLYSLLASPEYVGELDWSRVHLWFGDERCVPLEHDDSNYRMVKESLLDQLPQPPAGVHRIKGEREPEQAASDYAAELTAHLPPTGFDLVLLGMGPDGHTASLFPGSDLLGRRKGTAAAVYVPKLDSWRVTLTFPALNHTRHLLMLVSGQRKADVVRHVLRGYSDAMPLPVQMLRPEGQMEWLLDATAARHIEQKAIT